MPRLYHLNAYTRLRRFLRNHATLAEREMWQRLRRRQFHGLKFRRQEGIGPYIVDFFCPEKRLVVEIDGASHDTLTQKLFDQERTEYLDACYIRVVRFSNDEVVHDMLGVLQQLERVLFPTPNPSRIREGWR